MYSINASYLLSPIKLYTFSAPETSLWPLTDPGWKPLPSPSLCCRHCTCPQPPGSTDMAVSAPMTTATTWYGSPKPRVWNYSLPSPHSHSPQGAGASEAPRSEDEETVRGARASLHSAPGLFHLPHGGVDHAHVVATQTPFPTQNFPHAHLCFSDKSPASLSSPELQLLPSNVLANSQF